MDAVRIIVCACDRFLHWDKNDGEYFLKKVRGRKVMEMEDENVAMAQMIESFVESAPLKVSKSAAHLAVKVW